MITCVNSRLEESIEQRSGQLVRACYQCGKCSAGCQLAFGMDLLPHRVMKLVQYGQEARVLSCSTIWLCASCEACSARCPNGIDVAGVMDALRQASLESGIAPAQRDVVAFHRSFLAGIRLAGRTNEPVLIAAYKALSRRLFDDLGLGVVMLRKGKIKAMPRLVQDRDAIRRIFRMSERGSNRQ